jgi:hypothetical protein
MILFQIASLPLLFALVVTLPWDRGRVPAGHSLASTFFKGLLLFFPGYLAILIVRRIFGFSYDGVLLYLSLLLRNHLAPVLAALGGFLLLQKKLELFGSEEHTFLSVFAFLCGFFSMMNIADALRTWGGWDGYVVFLLPTLRIAVVLGIALSAQRFYRWEGRDGALFCGVGTALALVSALAAFLMRSARPGWAAACAVVFVLGAVLSFGMQFPRVIRG